MSEIIKRDKIIIAASPLHKNMSVETERRSNEPSLLVLWRKPLNVETADYVQIPWVWPRGVLPKTQKRSNAPHAGHAFATNPLLSPWVARGLPGGRPLGMAADTRIRRT